MPVDVLIAIAVVLGLTAFVVFKLVSSEPSGVEEASASFRIVVAPREPLPMQECVSEARRLGGYSVASARSMCDAGRSRQWYHALITNDGNQGGVPLCRALGFDASERRVFEGSLGLTILVFPGGGSYIRAHTSVAVAWYLPRVVRAPIAQYLANCVVTKRPPV